jgi:hemoglobin-like flavoprotein
VPTPSDDVIAKYVELYLEHSFAVVELLNMLRKDLEQQFRPRVKAIMAQASKINETTATLPQDEQLAHRLEAYIGLTDELKQLLTEMREAERS